MPSQIHDELHLTAPLCRRCYIGRLLWPQPLEELQAGDFLVRGLQGADLESGALAMGDDVKVGDRLRFMVRDQQGAVQDLAQQMAVRPCRPPAKPCQ